MAHEFRGAWITDERFAERVPECVFGRPSEKKGFVEAAPARELNANAHVLFLRAFPPETTPQGAVSFIRTDDNFKLHISGVFVTQEPVPTCSFLLSAEGRALIGEDVEWKKAK